MTNILFVCKHGNFRSRLAEACFNKYNKNKSLTASSAGFIKADKLTRKDREASDFQIKSAKMQGIIYDRKPKGLSISLLEKQDVIIITADDIQNIFTAPFYLKPALKVIRWKIPDIKGKKGDKEIVKRDIMEIKRKVKKLVNEMERKNGK